MAILSAVVSVLIGLAVSFAIFWALNWVVERTNDRWKARLLPYVFLFPVIILVSIFLLYPAIRTLIDSFMQASQRRGEGSTFVGFDNYISLFTDAGFLGVLLNNVLWVLVVPAGSVLIGLMVAVLTDKLGKRRETAFKAMIFLPMAISGVAAAVTWRFIYFYAPEGQPQIYLLNAIWSAFGGDPVPWITMNAGRLNSFLIMVIAIWLQVGFAMVLLSAAIKGVPEETIEAGRLDGASERRLFFNVVVPQIRGTIIAVFVTIVIFVMKVFDIIYAMTGGQYDTSVLAVEFYAQLFSFQNPGKAAAVVIVLMIAVVPLIVYQVRSYKSQEELR
ncbi:carbohydrate ABC transporter permease [Microbacterium sp. RU33B]|uniref:carbohydrate ABC transporter permease n=1 Tax=Microbacterium sp. RU33B TaxID=1907390 RepID=UPI0009634627|nr:sugar ABC transporter permease [Microbacterium sp. RU33B]SIT87518.1 alpha-glucoside transport system permease protein [Microbacterium sp. RU33B]